MQTTTKLKEKILCYAEETYGTAAEYLWESTPTYAVLRHSDNKKWYGILMDIPKQRLSLSGDGAVDILNIKCDPLLIGSLLKSDGFHPAYHMSKAHWITIRLDGSVPLEEILPLLNLSFEMTSKK